MHRGSHSKSSETIFEENSTRDKNATVLASIIMKDTQQRSCPLKISGSNSPKSCPLIETAKFSTDGQSDCTKCKKPFFSISFDKQDRNMKSGLIFESELKNFVANLDRASRISLHEAEGAHEVLATSKGAILASRIREIRSTHQVSYDWRAVLREDTLLDYGAPNLYERWLQSKRIRVPPMVPPVQCRIVGNTQNNSREEEEMLSTLSIDILDNFPPSPPRRTHDEDFQAGTFSFDYMHSFYLFSNCAFRSHLLWRNHSKISSVTGSRKMDPYFLMNTLVSARGKSRDQEKRRE